MEGSIIADAKVRRPRNWWKVGFFVLLLLFEFTRELAVLGGAEGAIPNDYATVYSSDGYVRAEGSWKRIDGGDSLIPGTATIVCRQWTGQCVEATVTINDNYVYAPDVTHFDATFAPDAVSYVNDVPQCVKYSVRIDLELKKVFAVRQKKPTTSDTVCKSVLEDRIEMQIADGRDTHLVEDPFKDHFVPLLRLVRALLV